MPLKWTQLQYNCCLKTSDKNIIKRLIFLGPGYQRSDIDAIEMFRDREKQVFLQRSRQFDQKLWSNFSFWISFDNN